MNDDCTTIFNFHVYSIGGWGVGGGGIMFPDFNKHLNTFFFFFFSDTVLVFKQGH